MTVSSSSAARYACEISGWNLSHLKLQKILYIAHMVFMGRNNGNPLVDEEFEAWDYGPILPSIYHRLKGFGTSSVKDVFYDASTIDGTKEGDLIREAHEQLRHKEPAELVAITYRPGGAWSNNHRSGRKHITIPNVDILDEYRNKLAAA